MIIEFSGGTGAGKSTYAAALHDLLSKSRPLVGCVMDDRDNACAAIPDTFTKPGRQNWRTDVRAITSAAGLWLRHPSFFLFLMARVWDLAESAAHKPAILRSVLRKSAIHGFLSGAPFTDVPVVVDEGLVHSAHNVLVSTQIAPAEDAVRRFAGLAPRPDVLVLVMATPEVLATRLRARGDLSPRIEGNGHVDAFSRHAGAVFRQLALDWGGTLIVIDSETEAPDAAARRIARDLGLVEGKTFNE